MIRAAPAGAEATPVRKETSVAQDPRDLDPARVQACLHENGGRIESTWRALNLSSRHVLVRLIKKPSLRTR